MTEQNVKRKLTAILSADVKGYSRLMSQDEGGTIRTLTVYKEAMSTLIETYRGRVVDAPGDNLLAEFTSVVDAVNCAVEIQRELAERNAELPEGRRMDFRIGVNLGDVVEKEERIYGDGVNIAARVESLAEGGGICVSGKVYEEVKAKLGLEYEYLGEQTVKNIPEQVPVYRVLSFPGAAAHRVIQAKATIERKWRNMTRASAVVAVVAAAAILIWIYLFRPVPPREEVASIDKMALPLPEDPSIAVLPFTNMSDDAVQEYFADGMTDDLITDLSKIGGLFVIARNSMFTYKGKPVKVKQVAEELGVRYVLEGSIRHSGDQVRINAQLIDATTGGHLWAERYDGTMDDVFALQDRITGKIVEALAVELTAGEEDQVARKETGSPEAYDAFLKGWASYRRQTPEDLARAVPYFEEAITLDPNYSRAHAALAAVYRTGALWYKSLGLSSYGEAMQKAKEHLDQAMKDPTALAHWVASEIYRSEGEYEEAIVEATRAISLDANDPLGHDAMAQALMWAGRPEEGVDFAKKAVRLDPRMPRYLVTLGAVQFNMEQYDTAARSLEEATRQNPNNEWGFAWLAVTYGQLGQEADARSALDTFKRLAAKLEWGRSFTMKTANVFLVKFKDPAARERFREGLIRAGLSPESEQFTAAKNLVSRKEDGYFEIEGATRVDLATAKALLDQGLIFVDAREERAWNAEHIPGAVNLHATNALSEARLSKIAKKDQGVVFYCDGKG
jgi:TolB-like protein/class 3 adenylate cyclase/cytochrome c-type biogenesis protein CcmH/NrfG